MTLFVTVQLSKRWQNRTGMHTRKRFQETSAKYRSAWDAYQVISRRNLDIVRDGGTPTKQDLLEEKQAGKTVELAREDLLGAISDVGH